MSTPTPAPVSIPRRVVDRLPPKSVTQLRSTRGTSQSPEGSSIGCRVRRNQTMSQISECLNPPKGRRSVAAVGCSPLETAARYVSIPRRVVDRLPPLVRRRLVLRRLRGLNPPKGRRSVAAGTASSGWIPLRLKSQSPEGSSIGCRPPAGPDRRPLRSNVSIPRRVVDRLPRGHSAYQLDSADLCLNPPKGRRSVAAQVQRCAILA